MAKVVFLRPYLETDATWEMIRTTRYMGLWYLASKLKSNGHSVWYLDEVVRNNGLNKTTLYRTELDGDTYKEDFLDISTQDYKKEKNRFFQSVSTREFVKKYSAFQNGKIVRILAKTGNTIEETLDYIGRIEPDYVGISLVTTANLRAAVKTARAIKDHFPNTKIIFGGHHISAIPQEFVNDYPWVDHVVIGDAIDIIEDIVEGKVKDQIVNQGFRAMDRFPLLDMELIEAANYPIDQQYSYPSFGRKSTDFMFSKGCFRSCEFCVAGGQTDNRVVFLNWDLIDEQLRIFKEAGIQELVIQDDAFIFGGKKVMAKKLSLMKKYGFYWQNSGGIDFELLTDDITDLFIEYNKSGPGRLTGMYIPFNPRLWNKGSSATGTMVTRYDRHFENLKRLREEGNVYVFTSEIVGEPNQTWNTIVEDIDRHKEMILEGYLDTALTLSATMLPGTKWYEDNGHNIINKKDILGYSLFTTHHKTDNLPDPQLIEELFALRTKELNSIQQTFNWQTPFPNSEWAYAR